MVPVWRMALSTWWRDIVEYAVLNLLWLGLTLTIIGAPPATAAMYQMAYSSIDRDYIGFRPFFRALRDLFFPAWRWMFLQIVPYGIILFNLLYYTYATGTLWTLLRIIWITGFCLLSVLNIYFWAFFVRQDDRRFTTTYRNVLVMVARHPLLVLSTAFWVLLILVVSLWTRLLVPFGMMALVALFATSAVHSALASARPSPEVRSVFSKD